MDIFLIGLSIICLVIGLLGCILPMLPGPPLAYVGLLLLHATEYAQFSSTQLWSCLFAVVVVQILDYITPILGSKYSGGTKWGNWGCVIGTIMGVFFLPLGIIIGPFIGAIVGELLGGRGLSQAMKAGLGSLVGFLLGTVVKLLLCGYLVYLFILFIVEVF